MQSSNSVKYNLSQSIKPWEVPLLPWAEGPTTCPQTQWQAPVGWRFFCVPMKLRSYQDSKATDAVNYCNEQSEWLFTEDGALISRSANGSWWANYRRLSVVWQMQFCNLPSQKPVWLTATARAVCCSCRVSGIRWEKMRAQAVFVVRVIIPGTENVGQWRNKCTKWKYFRILTFKCHQFDVIW